MPVKLSGSGSSQPAQQSGPTPNAPAPPPINVFEGLDRFNFGSTSPSDANGDVGPTDYIQTVNTSAAIYRKSDGFQEAAFSLNTFMSQGSFGNLCDTNNMGDPVVLYDTFEDRWIISDFAFLTDGSGNAVAPAFQCIAASMSGNPVSGGWNFYSRQISDGLNDYPKLGIWPDGLYMSANMNTFGAAPTFKNARVWAFNKAQMYAGAPTAQVVSFDVSGGDSTVLPGNARLQTGTPPAGRPNLFISTQLFTNALTVYKFHVDWNYVSLSTFTGPDVPIAATSWPNAAVANVPQSGTATLLDALQIRAMAQNQYTNIGANESLWVSHTVRRAAGGSAAPRWYQVDVSGGTVAAAIPQAATWDPDAANAVHRWMPSLALDRAGNLAIGYSTSSATAFPSIAYAGRLAGDPVNTFSKTEQTLFTGTASQTGSTRWGEYSAMTLDPDGCTFWYTSQYANPADQTVDHRWLTKFGSFRYSECTPVGAGGTISGTVTANPGGAPISGASVKLGARSTTTDGSGNYSFGGIPAGTYPLIGAGKAGFASTSVASIAVTDAGTTTQDFSLTGVPASACLVDTTQADFLAGAATNVDVNISPGDVTLLNAPTIDQSNTAGTTTGTGFGTPTWTGQTFIPAITGLLVKADGTLFCNGCGATPPNLTLSVRNVSGGLPTGADLATVTIPGSLFASGSTVTFTGSFGSPATLTAGTQYALILRPVSVPAGSGYFWIRSSPSTYANGSRVLSADSGGTWSTDTTRDYNFKTYMQTGYAASGNLVSSTKDANPAQDYSPTWATLSWNASMPANTALSFQVAASNSEFGPFTFVGPDSTAGTFFTSSGASLSQFNGKRYLQYRANFATTNSTTTPTVSDVTTCYVDNPPADLSITKNDGTTTAPLGGSVTYTITASNAGPGAASNATVTDSFPAGETCNWTCVGASGGTCSIGGTGDIVDGVDLPVGGTATYSATCDISIAASGSLSNTATISGASAFVADAVPGNNSATDTDAVGQSSNLAITKTDGVTTATPGGSVTYTITASNAGPSNAPASIVADTFPASLTCTWTCVGAGGGTCTAAGAGNINDSVNLPVGGSVTYTPSCTVAASATGSLVNTATAAVQAGAVDPTPGNNSATDIDTLTPQADLAITKTDGVTTATPGGSVTYTITASNAGPSNATGATVADTFPASETCTWTCAGAGGGTCTAAGSGNINNSVNVPVGGSTTYTASCSVSGSATGSLSNTATVTAPGGVTDPTPGNNSATDTDTVLPLPDLALTMTDNHAIAAVGKSVYYIINVTNSAGPGTATAVVTDALPAGLYDGNWVCIPYGGATCASGFGNTLSDTVTLPVGAQISYVYSATVVSGDANDQVTNTASVALTIGTDPSPANNSATDTDLLVILKDGFDGTPLMVPIQVGTGTDFVTATLRIDANLLNTLNIVPTEVASGRTANGTALFTVELARFGNDIALRALTTNERGWIERSNWQRVVDVNQNLLAFAWQSASSDTNDGYLNLSFGGASVVIGGRNQHDPLTKVWVTVEHTVPWFVLIAH
ncbi:MAG: carboxypeptidase regulatory-like domain-containing protein [Tahibacter sp.]